MKIGIFGGTFDPIHCGHLRSAEDVRETFGLDRLYFVPAARPPHKSREDIASAEHRFKMVELAVADHPAFVASAVELERSGPSYSIDTIRHFLATDQPATLALMLGIDAFRDLPSWKDSASIPALCDLIVTTRPGEELPPATAFLPVALQNTFWYDPAIRMYRHASGHFLTLHHIAGLSIASSTLRHLMQQGRSLRYLVPAAVEAYITNHRLYKAEECQR